MGRANCSCRMRSRWLVEDFDSFFQERFTQEAVKLYQIKLLIYDPFKEAIVEWKE